MPDDDFRVAQPRVAAGVLIRDDDGRVLLVKPTYKSGWDLPGGYVEPGESPMAAAMRELKEELDVAPKIGRLLVVDWAPHPDEGDKLLFVFEADFLPLSVLQTDGEEIADAAYVPRDELVTHLGERLLNRVLAAMEDLPSVYLERGQIATRPAE